MRRDGHRTSDVHDALNARYVVGCADGVLPRSRCSTSVAAAFPTAVPNEDGMTFDATCEAWLVDSALRANRAYAAERNLDPRSEFA